MIQRYTINADDCAVWASYDDNGYYVLFQEHEKIIEDKDARIEQLEQELIETKSSLWRICPNTYTIPCEINNFAIPDPFEGPGETYQAAYERLNANNVKHT